MHQIGSKNEWLLLPASFKAKFGLAFVLTLESAFLSGFILKPTERAQVLLKSGTRDFQNSLPFERSACFYMTIAENFKRFQYFDFETDFPENENLFSKNWSIVFQLKAVRLKMHYFHTKVPYQRPMLRQIKW